MTDDAAYADSDDEFDCAFCDGRVVPSRSAKDGPYDGLIHTMPTCETFDRLSVEDFVSATYARMQSGGRAS